MRILFVSQHYWPEPFNFSDICEQLVSDGYEVTVLTGMPNYPEGFIYDDYKHYDKEYEIHNGVKIIRVPIVPRKQSVISRAVNYYDFANKACKRVETLAYEYDVVLSIFSSPVMAGRPAVKAANKFNIPLIGYILDLWPESLTAGGIKRGSLIYNHYKKVSQSIYGAADLLLVTSPMFEDYLIHELDCRVKTECLPQYAEDLFSNNNQCFIPNGYDDSKVNLTFAGNVGSAQSVDIIIKAANLLKEDSRFLFHIVGSGKELESCMQLVEDYQLSNVIFHGRKPLEDMPSYYSASDAMIVTFSDMPVLEYTLPRKVQSYMCASKPILAGATGEVTRVVEDADCGLAVPSCSAEKFAEICREFADCSNERKEEFGLNSFKYYKEKYDKKLFFESLEEQLNNIVQ